MTSKYDRVRRVIVEQISRSDPSDQLLATHWLFNLEILMHLTNSMLIHRSARGIALLGAILIAGCDNSNDPDQTAGVYSAVALTTTVNGQSFNHIANGSMISLELAEDGTTMGLMHIEANGTEPDFNADLTGTWTQTGSTVHVEHSDDTFLNDMPLTVNNNSLTGDITLSSGRIQLTLLQVFD